MIKDQKVPNRGRNCRGFQNEKNGKDLDNLTSPQGNVKTIENAVEDSSN